jgi:two-component system response regulator AtoC
MSLNLPPLRDRIEDVGMLCDYFIKHYALEMKKQIKGYTEEARRLIESYSFPRNVRQLANMLEYAVIVCSGEFVDVCDLPEEIRAGANTAVDRAENALDDFLSGHTLKEIEKRAIELTLKKNGGKREKTADDLGISRRGLQNKIAEYHLQ